MRQEVLALLANDPFKPFRIKLINGDAHDVEHPLGAAVLDRGPFIAPRDGEWVEFRYNRIASLESLLEFQPYNDACPPARPVRFPPRRSIFRCATGATTSRRA